MHGETAVKFSLHVFTAPDATTCKLFVQNFNSWKEAPIVKFSLTILNGKTTANDRPTALSTATLRFSMLGYMMLNPH